MQQPLVLFILCILCIDVHKKISIPWRRCRSIQVAEMGGAVPGVVRAGRPRSQEAFIHTKNREHDLHHAGESGKTPYASLEYRRSPQWSLNLDTADGQDLNESCCKPFCPSCTQPTGERRQRQGVPPELQRSGTELEDFKGGGRTLRALLMLLGLGLGTYLVYRLGPGRLLSLLLRIGMALAALTPASVHHRRVPIHVTVRRVRRTGEWRGRLIYLSMLAKETIALIPLYASLAQPRRSPAACSNSEVPYRDVLWIRPGRSRSRAGGGRTRRPVKEGL